ncbi:MAG TPA: Na+/H+ antiporter NhaA [Vicinamibacterales bacterium]|nr:Na+/H+ antiporter NhaA [Vicinamibacterales bacterium]
MARSSGPSHATLALKLIIDNSLLLIVGAVTALVWANVSPATYEDGTHGVVHFLVNDVGMVFFFALATKEVVEAMLPGGALSSPRKASVPIFAAVGGMAAPAALFLTLIAVIGRPDLHSGWAIPCATDIAFSYLVARVVFPNGHPAIPFLLLLAIADDALGLILLAIFYPTGVVSLTQLVGWLGPAVLLAWALRKTGVESFWFYVIGPGVLAWCGLFLGGLHPALALVPIVPFMPHHASELKLFSGRATQLRTMHHFERWWKLPVQLVLFAFGLVNAGVPLASIGPVTWIIAAALIVGKPVGIVGTTAIAGALGFPRAAGLDLRAMIALGITAGIGFTVALFFTTASFPPGVVLEQAKMGALLSFLAAPIAILAGRLLRIGTVR